MVGSWIGRALIGLPAVLGAVGAGAIVTGWLGEIAPGVATAVLLAGIAVLRASRTGINVDVEAGVIIVQGFWRDSTLAATDLEHVDVSFSPETGAPCVQLVTTAGQVLTPLALTYVADDVTDRLMALISAAAGRPVDVLVERPRLRPSPG